MRNKDGQLSFFKEYLDAYEKTLWNMVQNGETAQVFESKLIRKADFYNHKI